MLILPHAFFKEFLPQILLWMKTCGQSTLRKEEEGGRPQHLMTFRITWLFLDYKVLLQKMQFIYAQFWLNFEKCLLKTINHTTILFLGQEINRVAVDLTCGPYTLKMANELATQMGMITIRQQDLNLNRLDTQQYLSRFPGTWEVEYCFVRTPTDFQATPENPFWSPPWWNQTKYGRFYDMVIVRSRLPPSYRSDKNIRETSKNIFYVHKNI